MKKRFALNEKNKTTVILSNYVVLFVGFSLVFVASQYPGWWMCQCD